MPFGSYRWICWIGSHGEWEVFRSPGQRQVLRGESSPIRREGSRKQLCKGYDAVVIATGVGDKEGDTLLAEIRTHWLDLPVIIVGVEADSGSAQARSVRISRPYTARMIIESLARLGVGRSGGLP